MIRQWLIDHAASELWALAWHFGIIGLVGAAGVVWFFFGPVLKQVGLYVAIGAAIIFVTAGIYTKLGADYANALNDGRQHSIDRTVDGAVTGADADVRGVRRDPFNREEY